MGSRAANRSGFNGLGEEAGGGTRAERKAGESIKEGGAGRRGALPKIQNRGQKSDSRKTPKSQGGVRDLLSGAGGRTVGWLDL